jgi:hypothetical protein
MSDIMALEEMRAQVWAWTEITVKWIMPSRFSFPTKIRQKPSRVKVMFTVVASTSFSTAWSHWLHCQFRVLLRMLGALSGSGSKTKASAFHYWCSICCTASHTTVCQHLSAQWHWDSETCPLLIGLESAWLSSALKDEETS